MKISRLLLHFPCGSSYQCCMGRSSGFQVNAISAAQVCFRSLTLTAPFTFLLLCSSACSFALSDVILPLHYLIFLSPVAVGCMISCVAVAAREASESAASINRIGVFLNQEMPNQYRETSTSSSALLLSNIKLGWGSHHSQQPFELQVPQLQVSRGNMLGVCGTVATGKSSLLQAILGEPHF